jgi:polysaccharide pyruvyl transferase WcaK-like protein
MATTFGPQHELSPQSIVLVGDTAPADPGRDAVLTAVLRSLPSAADITLVSPDPARTARRHGRPAIAATDMRGVLRSVRRAGAVVLSGDTLLGARRERRGRLTLKHLQGLLSIAAFAHANRASVLSVGLATADLTSPAARALARGFIRRADLTVFRDEDSARTIVRAGAPAPVRVGADPAWTLVDEARDVGLANADESADVVVLLSCVELPGPLAQKTIRLVSDLAACGLRIRIENWNHAALGDQVLLRRFTASAPAVRVGAPAEDLPKAVAALAGARLVVTGRVHGQIAAAAAGVPCLSLEQESGQHALAEHLGQASQPLSASSGELLDAALNALSGAPADEAAMKSEAAAAHASLDLLRLMLGVGDISGAAVDGLRLEGVLS